MDSVFKDIAIGLIEAICMERGLLKTKEVDGMPAMTLRVAEDQKVKQLPITEEVEQELKSLFSDEDLKQLYDAIGYKSIMPGDNQKANLSGMMVSFSFSVMNDATEIKYHIPQNYDSHSDFRVSDLPVYKIKDNGMNIAA